MVPLYTLQGVFNGRYDRPFSQSETDLRDEPHTQFVCYPAPCCACGVRNARMLEKEQRKMRKKKRMKVRGLEELCSIVNLQASTSAFCVSVGWQVE